ncbi:MAG TPA: DUF3040 domain-containing protein [Mycobacteriales bacterium]|nr:DUF3040 domain-containing protein [Mycobacteriales bacterium]
MPLSEHEQRLLEQIEQSLYAEDPKFARTWRSRDLGALKRNRVVRAAIAFVVGLAVLLAGVITLTGHAPLGIGLGVGGFLIMLGSAWYVFASRALVRPARTSKPPRPHRSVLGRLEDRWERRQDDQGRG